MLFRSLTNLLRHERVRDALTERFTDIHRSLKQDNAERVADAIAPFLRRGAARLPPAAAAHAAA